MFGFCDQETSGLDFLLAAPLRATSLHPELLVLTLRSGVGLLMNGMGT